MEYKIENRPVFTTLTIEMARGERFKAEAGAMVSMSPGIELQAKASGKGLLGTLAAAAGGESMFGSLFTATEAGELVLAPSSPGDIIQITLHGDTIMAQGGAYLAGSESLVLSTQGSFKAMLAGEGLFLSKISGTGDLFLASYGSVYERQLRPGETYIVDCTHIVAFTQDITYKVKKAAKGLFSTMASGEGLVAEYTGPGKLWIQSRNLRAFASLLAPLMTK